MKFNGKNNLIKALERILQVPFTVVQGSSRVYAMGYREKNMDLFVVFTKDFSIYKYTSVPSEVWDKLKEASKSRFSVGKTLQQLVINPQYPYVRMELRSSKANDEK